MPSQLELPSVQRLRRAFEAGVKFERDESADTHDGAMYDLLGGIGALVFYRLATRDRDIFRALYFDTAESEDLERIVPERFPGESVILATRGAGNLFVRRPNAAGGAGTFWKGTRISVLPAGVGHLETYEVAVDTAVSASALTARVPIQADHEGSGVEIDTTGIARFEDELWDSSWFVTRLVSGDGTDREKPQDTRARIRKARFDRRVGYAKAISDTLIAAGATEVALFASDFLATNPSNFLIIGELDDGYGDVGLNRAIVADASFTTSEELLRNCRVAIDTVAIAGSALQVLPMQPVLVTLAITIHTWDDPGRFHVAGIRTNGVRSVENYFETRQNPFYFREAGIRGAIIRVIPDVQAVDITMSYTLPGAMSPSTTEPDLPTLFTIFPVARFYVSEDNISIQVQGPV